MYRHRHEQYQIDHFDYRAYEDRKLKRGNWVPVSRDELRVLSSRQATFLSSIISFSKCATVDSDGWFPLEFKLCERLTGLDVPRQERVIKTLEDLGVLEVRHDHRSYRFIRINVRKLERLI